MTATEMKMDVNVFRAIIGGCFLRECDSASIVNVEVDRSGDGYIK